MDTGATAPIHGNLTPSIEDKTTDPPSGRVLLFWASVSPEWFEISAANRPDNWNSLIHSPIRVTRECESGGLIGGTSDAGATAREGQAIFREGLGERTLTNCWLLSRYGQKVVTETHHNSGAGGGGVSGLGGSTKYLPASVLNKVVSGLSAFATEDWRTARRRRPSARSASSTCRSFASLASVRP